MQISGLTLRQFENIVAGVSAGEYGGNIIVAYDAHDNGGKRRPRCTARLAARDSRGPGTRRSWSGRRGPYACWHAYRDVLAAVFAMYPDAVIRTGMVTYRGANGFRSAYPDTAYRNIGSQFSPVTMPELCDC